MNTEDKLRAKRDWVNALRSGDYKQTYECLRNTKGYCCLGVLCDLYTKVNLNGHWEEGRDDPDYNFYVGPDKASQMPPKSVMEWVGIDTILAQELSEMNDLKYSFNSIANAIEEETTLNETAT